MERDGRTPRSHQKYKDLNLKHTEGSVKVQSGHLQHLQPSNKNQFLKPVLGLEKNTKLISTYFQDSHVH